jgi:UDP-GlcNAc:undecaprenyl-phosphate/decaprenyl-phosphate GlcNAc-1-phosphate transferase
MPLALKLFLYFAGTMGFTLVMVYLLLGFSKSLGIRSKNDIHVRWSNTSKPSLGGIAIFVSVFLSMVIYLISHPTQNIFGDQRFLFFFVGISLAFFMGLADDAFNTKPFIKLLTQFLCGGSLVAGNLLIPVTDVFWIDALITIIWVIGLMNSLNMLDNMDGITASIAINTLLLLLAFSLFFKESSLDVNTFIVIGLLGSLCGFLFVNAPPSKLFMGDSGSQVIGYAIAYYSVYFIWFKQPNSTPFWVSTYSALLILAIPFIDTFTVTFNRIKQGKSPAKGGKDHTTHHMAYRGFSERKTFIYIWIISLVLGCLGLLVMSLYRHNFSFISSFPIIPFFIAFYFLFKNTHAYKAPIKNDHVVD